MTVFVIMQVSRIFSLLGVLNDLLIWVIHYSVSLGKVFLIQDLICFSGREVYNITLFYIIYDAYVNMMCMPYIKYNVICYSIFV